MATVYKKNKFLYYLKSFILYGLPCKKADIEILELEKKLTREQLHRVYERVAYYNGLKSAFEPKEGTSISDLKKPITPKAYYFDTYEYARYFPKETPIDYVFGDVIDIPETPSIVKSRPISKENQNSVLLNLDKVRHFVHVNDDIQFESKQDLLIGRLSVTQPHRIDFYEKYFEHPMCDLGQVNDWGGNPLWRKNKISLKDHLKYKFILSIEGYDVATNLKWIMSSASIAVSPKLVYETWYMEGTLEPNHHYIEIKKDYSDLPDKLEYYLSHPKEAKEIIANANEYFSHFLNPYMEDLCSLLVLKKYINLSKGIL